ncbi:Membrane protein, suppressor for copper-sensitivity ScsD [hydrothermal vent metagenome]|uniref:Membrane protein, suppressor for copper-sensitivity ScsD n=1 Tax=hydrothermal vent metagenome TaxID=652676 RepID=A0A1W1EB95_9ZZZZ
MKKINIKKIIKDIVIFAVSLFIISNVISYIRKPEIDFNILTSMKIELLNGEEFNFHKGKPFVVHFWADWCKVCKVEASNIQSVSEKYDVLTIAVSSGSDEKVKAYMKKRGLTFNVYNDINGSLAKKFKVQAFPTTLIYDGKGELKFSEVGYTTTVGLLGRLSLLK